MKAHAASALEVAVLDEVNKARTDPAGYQVSPCGYPAAQVEDARNFLKKQSPIAALGSDGKLTAAAAAHVADQGPRGQDSHVGSDGSTPARRMQTAGVWAQIYGEVISVKQTRPTCTAGQLIIDPPGPRHPHREDLFNPLFKLVGVACGPNTTFETMCVIDLSATPLGE